jgi:hypothetical protein
MDRAGTTAEEYQTMAQDLSEAHESFPIHIDREMFKVTKTSMTGAELRALTTPPIGPDRDLYQVVPGGQDVLVKDDVPVGLKPGTHFVTAPKKVTPGSVDGGR